LPTPPPAAAACAAGVGLLYLQTRAASRDTRITDGTYGPHHVPMFDSLSILPLFSAAAAAVAAAAAFDFSSSAAASSAKGSLKTVAPAECYNSSTNNGDFNACQNHTLNDDVSERYLYKGKHLTPKIRNKIGIEDAYVFRTARYHLRLRQRVQPSDHTAKHLPQESNVAISLCGKGAQCVCRPGSVSARK
jgi:hypothetical protein